MNLYACCRKTKSKWPIPCLECINLSKTSNRSIFRESVEMYYCYLARKLRVKADKLRSQLTFKERELEWDLRFAKSHKDEERFKKSHQKVLANKSETLRKINKLNNQFDALTKQVEVMNNLPKQYVIAYQEKEISLLELIYHLFNIFETEGEKTSATALKYLGEFHPKTQEFFEFLEYLYVFNFNARWGENVDLAYLSRSIICNRFGQDAFYKIQGSLNKYARERKTLKA